LSDGARGAPPTLCDVTMSDWARVTVRDGCVVALRDNGEAPLVLGR
jgi:hypothetical protein